jgi:glycosyltransferase involved in cell wall biosynthesis
VRVLIVSYYFPPAAGGGVQRVLKLAKYLPQHGVEVHVLAPDDPQWMDAGGLEVPSGTVVHRAQYIGPKPGRPKDMLAGKRGVSRLVAKVLLQPRRLLVPDLHRTWSWTAVRAGVRAVKEHNVDVIVSTSPPETDHIIGRKIAQRTGRPWIADLRDSWLAEPGLRLDSPLVRWKHRRNVKLSNRTVGQADRIVTVSEPIADELRERYPNVPVSVIANGVDLEDVAAAAAPVTDPRFTVLYTGNFFGRRSPRTFLTALDALLERRPELAPAFRVRFIGALKAADAAWLAEQSRLRPVVTVEAFLPYDQALHAQRSADLLLLIIAGGDPRHAGEVTGKVFEYIAAQRPILATVPTTGAAAELLAEHPATDIVDPDDTSAIAEALEARYEEWQRGRVEDLNLPPTLIDRISREARAADYAALLHRCNE